MPAILSELFTPLTEFLIPDRCAACDGPVERPGLGWCDSCFDDLPWLAAGKCSACLGPVHPSDGCQRCAAAGRPWRRAFSAVHYRGEMARLVARWKYGPDVTLTRPLIRALGHALVNLEAPRDAVVVPIPQGEDAWQHRGFSPSLELARACSTMPGARRVVGLRRCRSAPAQVGLTASGRRSNVQRLFDALPRFDGRHVLLVDDVMTTGATVTSASEALRKAGAASVTVVSLARAEHA